MMGDNGEKIKPDSVYKGILPLLEDHKDTHKLKTNCVILIDESFMPVHGIKDSSLKSIADKYHDMLDKFNKERGQQSSRYQLWAHQYEIR